MVSTVTIISCAALLLLTIAGNMANPFFRIPKTKKDDSGEGGSEDGDKGMPISVIVMVNGDMDALERNLPLFLDQEYEPEFQVIVVKEKGNAKDYDPIKKFADNPHLATTFIPDTSRYISREKLGVTLGIKAAANEWCVLVNSQSHPTSRLWLKEISRKCSADKNIVIGYSNYDKDALSYMRFYRLQHFVYLWRECRKGTAYCANGANLAFRKSEFIDQDGFRGNLDIVRGEFDFIVNKLARKGTTAVVTSPEGSLVEDRPTKKQWHRLRVFHIHSCKHMQRNASHRLQARLDTLLLHLTLIATVGSTVAAAVFGDYILLATALVALVMLIAGRTFAGIKAVKAFNADISAWRIIPLELASVWHSLADKMRYFKTDSNDFTCHKI